MASPTTSTTTPPSTQREEPTFRNYTSLDAERYSTYRPPYPDRIISTILTHHLSTTPQPNTRLLLDVGCGPGNSTRSFSPYFTSSIGIDPSPAMISTARSLSSSTTNTSYQVCSAEHLSSCISTLESVDLITAATSAHWFSLPEFYTSALSVLKPGGTLAMWCTSSFYPHPRTPNYTAIYNTLQSFENETLAEFELPGNKLCREMYDSLPLPWTCEPVIEGWDQGSFRRVEFNRSGNVDDTRGEFVKGEKMNLEEMGKALGTSSMVSRWREKYGEEVKRGERRDCVEELKGRLREAREEGREWEFGTGIVVLLIKKAI